MSKKRNTRNTHKAQTSKKRGNSALVSDKIRIAEFANQGEWPKAQELLSKTLTQWPEDIELQELQARIHHHCGNLDAAKQVLTSLLERHPTLKASLTRLSQIVVDEGRLDEGLNLVNRALKADPGFAEALGMKAHILYTQGHFTEALEINRRLLQLQPSNYVVWNNAGNTLRDLGRFAEAEEHYKKAITLSDTDSRPYANLLTTLHYHPDASREMIHQVCLEWEKHYAPSPLPPRTVTQDKQPGRRLRIGMISDGFRNHPVGRMIIAAMEKLPRHAYSLHAYSSNNIQDDISHRFKTICEWHLVKHLTDEQLAQRIRDDKIDILIDMAGYHNNTRMATMAAQPAPLLVKWVGGLINTTGLSTIDYLISDAVESPEGEDAFYTEKLIRMPGDYICYEPPSYIAPLESLPAATNGYITLGCFNNPTKINEPLLQQWAEIMQSLPDSKLFLKGKQYSSEEFCERITDIMQSTGIDASRLIFEGLSPHADVFKAYNRVDIALDPWPYSGGLTTCEAFVMGVPVVTMPGPTFAGRHSATHLVNAGMPELVTHSWDEYRARVIELASDLDSLATIRSHLRTILLQSPVCDADSFAGHLNNALRAIWQRYCEGKQPEALSFNEQGEVLFADETEPMQLQHPEAPEPDDNSEFKWEFQGKVIAIDHGGQLMDMPTVKQMLDLGTLELIEFDPASNYLKHPLRQHKSVHYYPNVALGDGQPATLYACQAPEQSGTLKPAPHEYMPEKLQQDLSVLAELPIGTVALDKVSELPSVDWLVLDDLNDAAALLNNGIQTLRDTLLIHARVAFQPTHEKQPDFSMLSAWAAQNGFRFYCFLDDSKITPLAGDNTAQHDKRYSSELQGETALFIPNQERIQCLNTSQKVKLAFIADTFYDLRGLSYSTLESENENLSCLYLQSKNKIDEADKPRVKSDNAPAKTINAFKVKENTFVHLCFNNMHVEPLLTTLNDKDGTKYNNIFLIECRRSIADYDVNISQNSNTFYFDSDSELQRVINICIDKNTKGIFIHGLFFDWQHTILKSLCGKKPTVWAIWGGDLYNNINNSNFIYTVNHCIDYVATSLDSEIKLFKKYFKPKPTLTLQYDFGYDTIEVKSQKQKIVFIGNSGDPSNNHVDIIRSLATKKDANDYEYVIPYTYNGTQAGLDEIREEIRKSNLRKVSLLTRHLSKSEYYELLSHASLYISAHDRQQGFGHITACLYFGINVVIKDYISVDSILIKNPVWNRIADNQGFAIQSFDQFKAAHKLAECIHADWARDNQQKSRQHYGPQASAEMFRKAFVQLEQISGSTIPPRSTPTRTLHEKTVSNALPVSQIMKELQNQRANRESQIPKYSLTLDHTRHCQALTNRQVMLERLPRHAVAAEIGVDEGKFSEKILSITQPATLHLIDIWGTDRFHDGKYRKICEKLKSQIDAGEVVIHKKLSTEAYDDFQDDYFDWIYIDTDHSYETTRDELFKYAPKIKADGLICGHDYTMGNWITGYRYGVIEAVHEFCIQHGWELIYITLDTTENQSFAIRRIKRG